MSLKEQFENCYPIVSGIGSTVLFAIFGKVPDYLPIVLPQVITINSINIGFLASAAAVMSANREAPLGQKLKSVGKFDLLIKRFVSAIKWNLVVAGFSIACLALLAAKIPSLELPFVALWLGIGVTGFLSTARVMTLFFETL